MALWKNGVYLWYFKLTFIFYKFEWNLQLLFSVQWNNWLVSTSMCSNSTYMYNNNAEPTLVNTESDQLTDERKRDYV